MRKLLGKIFIFCLCTSLLAVGILFVAKVNGRSSSKQDERIYAAEVDAEADAQVTTIEDGETPLSPGKSWSLLNLVFMIFIIFEFAMLFSEAFYRGKEERSILANVHADEMLLSAVKRRRTIRALSFPIAFVALVEFLITEDMSAHMVVADMYTVIMVILLIVQTTLVGFSHKKTLKVVAQAKDC